MSPAPAAQRLHERVVPFTAGDGFACNLINVRGEAEPVRGPVLVVHGAGVSARIFRPPTARTIVDALVDAGYDVWLENWRASIDFPANRWTLDQAALYDHPAAIAKVVEETGASELKAIIHCQGSTSFAMSSVAGLLPQVKTIVSNAVSLHPVIPFGANVKLKVAVPAIAKITPFVDAQWGLNPPHALAKALNLFVKLTHHECDNIVCRWSSFVWGLGFPTLWRHENLNDETHDWLSREFGVGPMVFFKQMGRSVKAGGLVSYDHTGELPANFTAQPPRTDARFALFAGEENRCFLYTSQVKTHNWFERHRPGYHSLHVIPRYAHLDVFMGKDAVRDVFPYMLEELNRANAPSASVPH